MTATNYFILGAILGALVFIEGTNLRNNEGRMTKIVAVISGFEFVWLLTCVYALFKIDFPSWTILIPAIYISYFIVASRHYHSLTKGIETIEDFKEVRIPDSGIKLEIYGGIGYLLINGLAWLQFSGTAS